jgi:hypothetical protein
MKSFLKYIEEGVRQYEKSFAIDEGVKQVKGFAAQQKKDGEGPEMTREFRRLMKQLKTEKGKEIVYVVSEPSERYRKKTGFGSQHSMDIVDRSDKPLGKKVLYHEGGQETTYHTVIAIHEATSVNKGRVPVYMKHPTKKGTYAVIGYTSKQATSIGAVKVSKDAYPGRKAYAEKTPFDKERFPEGVGWLVTHS